MTKYKHIKGPGDEKFRRLTGVKLATFEGMIAILSEADKEKKAKGGRIVYRRPAAHGARVYS